MVGWRSKRHVRVLAGCLRMTSIHAHRYNSDFALEWPRPLPPNVQLVGALLPRPARPLPPHFQVPILTFCVAVLQRQEPAAFTVVCVACKCPTFPVLCQDLIGQPVLTHIGIGWEVTKRPRRGIAPPSWLGDDVGPLPGL